MHGGCTFLIRKVQDASAQLADVRCSMPGWRVVCAHLRECVTQSERALRSCKSMGAIVILRILANVMVIM